MPCRMSHDAGGCGSGSQPVPALLNPPVSPYVLRMWSAVMNTAPRSSLRILRGERVAVANIDGKAASVVVAAHPANPSGGNGERSMDVSCVAVKLEHHGARPYPGFEVARVFSVITGSNQARAAAAGRKSESSSTPARSADDDVGAGLVLPWHPGQRAVSTDQFAVRVPELCPLPLPPPTSRDVSQLEQQPDAVHDEQVAILCPACRALCAGSGQ